MDSFLGELGREALTKVVELTVEHVWHGVFEPSKAHSELRQPEDGALQAMDAFLRLVAQRDMDGFLGLCDPTWAQQDDTAALMDATLEAAPPISWAFQEVRVPIDWRAGTRLPWAEATMLVTFDLDGEYDTISAELRAIQASGAWKIDFLFWGASSRAQPQPAPFADIFKAMANSGFQINFEPVVIECAQCGQHLRVPTDRGRLRVTCPRCKNKQWYQP